MPTRTLIVFAREPVPGRTKTRLCPPLAPEQAAALYACFLDDTLALARALAGVRALVAYAPEGAGSFFARLAPDLAAAPQRGDGLGARMDRATGLRAELLPPWYDIDTVAELRRLARDLRAAPPAVAPRTRAFLLQELPHVVDP